MFERGNIKRAIRDVLARRIMSNVIKYYGDERIAYQIATKMVEQGQIPDKSNISFWREVQKEYNEQISMMKNPYIFFNVIKRKRFYDWILYLVIIISN